MKLDSARGSSSAPGGREEPDAQQAPPALAVGGQLVAGGRHQIGDLLRVVREALAGDREPQAARPPVHQRHPRLLLQRGELVGDRRRAQPQLLRGGDDRAVPGDLQHDLQACGVEHRRTAFPAQGRCGRPSTPARPAHTLACRRCLLRADHDAPAPAASAVDRRPENDLQDQGSPRVSGPGVRRPRGVMRPARTGASRSRLRGAAVGSRGRCSEPRAAGGLVRHRPGRDRRRWLSSASVKRSAEHSDTISVRWVTVGLEGSR